MRTTVRSALCLATLFLPQMLKAQVQPLHAIQAEDVFLPCFLPGALEDATFRRKLLPLPAEYVEKYKGTPYDERLWDSYHARIRCLLREKYAGEITKENTVFIRRDTEFKDGTRRPILRECFFYRTFEKDGYVWDIKGYLDEVVVIMKDMRLRYLDKGAQDIFSRVERYAEAHRDLLDECTLTDTEVEKIKRYVTGICKEIFNPRILPETEREWEEILKDIPGIRGALRVKLPLCLKVEGDPLCPKKGGKTITLWLHRRVVIAYMHDTGVSEIEERYPAIWQKVHSVSGETQAEAPPLNPEEVTYVDCGTYLTQGGSESVPESATGYLVKVVLKHPPPEISRDYLACFETNNVRLPVTEEKRHILEYALLTLKFRELARKAQSDVGVEGLIRSCVQIRDSLDVYMKAKQKLLPVLPKMEETLLWLKGLRVPSEAEALHQRLVRLYQQRIECIRFVTGEEVEGAWKEALANLGRVPPSGAGHLLRKSQELMWKVEEKYVSWKSIEEVVEEIHKLRHGVLNWVLSM